ncbi:hypothetical protein SprV_0501739700 [Sparganum proliferum]
MTRWGCVLDFCQIVSQWFSLLPHSNYVPIKMPVRCMWCVWPPPRGLGGAPAAAAAAAAAASSSSSSSSSSSPSLIY